MISLVLGLPDLLRKTFDSEVAGCRVFFANLNGVLRLFGIPPKAGGVPIRVSILPPV
jgi:hypothetical protein